MQNAKDQSFTIYTLPTHVIHTSGARLTQALYMTNTRLLDDSFTSFHAHLLLYTPDTRMRHVLVSNTTNVCLLNVSFSPHALLMHTFHWLDTCLLHVYTSLLLLLHAGLKHDPHKSHTRLCFNVMYYFT